MNQNEISEILPPLNQEQRQEHYLNEYDEFQKENIFQLTGQKHEQEESQEIIYQSKLHPQIYYAKKLMKQLLEQRSYICQFLKLKPMKGSSVKNKTQQMIKEQKDVINTLRFLFRDSPALIDDLSLVNITDCLGIYTFFSSDGKFVPLCKLCNKSVYAVTRYGHSKIICSNSKCKLKLLGEYMSPDYEKKSLNNSRKQTEMSQRSKKDTQKSDSSHKNSRKFTKEELAMIKKTAQKIVYP